MLKIENEKLENYFSLIALALYLMVSFIIAEKYSSILAFIIVFYFFVKFDMFIDSYFYNPFENKKTFTISISDLDSFLNERTKIINDISKYKFILISLNKFIIPLYILFLNNYMNILLQK